MNGPQLQIYEFDEFRLDVAKRLLTKGDDESIPLTPKVFDTLLYLVRHRGTVIGKDELMREIWSDSFVEENNLSQNISILRRAFGEKPGEQRFIATVAGHGYRFIPEVSEVGTSESHPSISDVEPGIPSSRSERQNRKWFIAFAVLIVLTIGSGGYYLLRGNKISGDAPIKTIAVLPFKSLVVENRNEALELGMADTLISKLSGGEGIIVRPLSSIRRYDSIDQDALTAARELTVESVLDGTIQTWGDRVRVSAKLLRSSDGKQLWAEQFDEKFTDIFAVQDTISEKVAVALRVRLSRRKHPTESIEAAQLYMKGRYYIAKATPPDLLASIPFFKEAIDIDPGYALAYTGLSNAYGVLGLTGDLTIPDAVTKSRAAERKALELDDTLGEAHIARCMGTFWYDWDWHLAEEECVRAIEIAPNNSDFHGNYAMVLSNTGRHADAIAEAKRSRELNPVNLIQIALEGQFLLHAGRVDEALIQLRKASELEPKFWMPHMIAASAYIEKGMFAEAIAESRKEFELTGGNIYPFGTYAMAKSGRHEEAQAGLNDLLRSSGTKSTSPYNIALIYNGLEMTDKTLEWLERGHEGRDPKMTFLKVEPKWNNLRNEPRFVDLIKRLNLQ